MQSWDCVTHMPYLSQASWSNTITADRQRKSGFSAQGFFSLYDPMTQALTAQESDITAWFSPRLRLCAVFACQWRRTSDLISSPLPGIC